MHTFQHINALRHARAYAERFLDSPKVRYRGTVKIHGSNTAVVCTLAGLQAQSRTREISPEDDCAGFATWVAQFTVANAIRAVEHWVRNEHQIPTDHTVVLFGEWCGPGIHRGVAVNALPTRRWVLFAVEVVDPEGNRRAINAVPSMENPELGVHSVMDAKSWEVEIDFADPEQIARAADQITQWVGEVERCCPYARLHGVDGTGEGIVWTPVGPHWGISDLVFKTKGEAHKVEGGRGVKLQVEALPGVDAFVTMFVTPARIDQGLENLRQAGTLTDMRAMGAFLKWLHADVQREGAAELTASGLTWKQVQGAVTKRAVDAYKAQANA